MSYEYIDLEIRAGRAELTLNRPGKLNALRPETFGEMADAVDAVSGRSDVKCLILAGRGRHFTGGVDVTVRMSGTDTKRDWMVKRASMTALAKLADAPVVKLCKLHGYVTGAGLLLAAACNLRYATPDATFYIPELELGIPFSLGGITAVARHLGIMRTAEMVLTCNEVPAGDASMRNFVTRVVAADAIDAHVDAVADMIVARPNALLLATLATLREAERALIPDPASDLFTMLFVDTEAETRALRARYSKRFVKGEH